MWLDDKEEGTQHFVPKAATPLRKTLHAAGLHVAGPPPAPKAISIDLRRAEHDLEPVIGSDFRRSCLLQGGPHPLHLPYLGGWVHGGNMVVSMVQQQQQQQRRSKAVDFEPANAPGGQHAA